MSRNNKNARNLAKARQITAMHKNGEKGPSRTAAVHGKKWTYRSNPASMKALAEFLKGTSATSEKTSGKSILRNAGSAARTDED